MASISDAERAQQALRKRFGRIPGVHGIGVTWNKNGDAHIRINVDSSRHEDISQLIPAEIDGVPVELRRVRGMRTFG